MASCTCLVILRFSGLVLKKGFDFAGKAAASETSQAGRA
jgi:hypothetical protein